MTQIHDLAHSASHDLKWMERALELARQGTALASPNPMVGAVLVRDGNVVGEGFHSYDNKKHAEIVAIEAAGEEARGATVFLTLEPCSHHGRTGPCAEALVAAGVSRVVAAMTDPNPLVSGKGFELLRKSAISVEVGLCKEQAERLNESFVCYIRHRRPFVTLKTAMTLDGKISAPDDNNGWITGEEARVFVHGQRHASDAILTGSGTVIADDPLLTDRSGLSRRRPLLRVVLDSHLKIPLTAKIFSNVHQDLLVFCSSNADPARRKLLQDKGVEVVSTSQNDRTDLKQVMDELGKREILNVLLEAGAALNWAAIEQRVVDKVFFYYAPKILGGLEAFPPIGGRGIRAMRDALPVRNIQIHRFGEDFAVEGYLNDPT